MGIFSSITGENSNVTVRYVAINYGTFLLGIILYLLYIKALNPIEIGLIAISRTWGQLFDYLHLGTRFSIDRYSPIRSSSFSTSLLLLTVTLTLLIGANFIAILYFAKQEETAFFSIIISSVVLALSNCFKAHFRALGKVEDLLLNGFMLQFLPLTINLVMFWVKPEIEILRFYCVPYLIAFFIWFACYRKIFLVTRPMSKMMSAGKYVYKHASSQFLYAAVTLFNITADRFYIDFKLGREMLGIYSIQLFVCGALSFLPATLSELKIREIMRNYSASPSLPSSRVILFVASPTIFFLVIAFILLFLGSNYYPIIKDNPLGFYISAVCVVPVIFTSLYSQTISASSKYHLLVPTGLLISVLNLTLISNFEIFGENFAIAGPLIKLLVSALEAILLFCLVKSIVGAASGCKTRGS